MRMTPSSLFSSDEVKGALNFSAQSIRKRYARHFTSLSFILLCIGHHYQRTGYPYQILALRSFEKVKVFSEIRLEDRVVNIKLVDCFIVDRVEKTLKSIWPSHIFVG